MNLIIAIVVGVAAVWVLAHVVTMWWLVVTRANGVIEAAKAHDAEVARPRLRPNVVTVPGDKLAELQRDAARFRKLLAWMSSNVPEGWEQVERIGALGAWESEDAMVGYLDSLPECNVGLCSKGNAGVPGAGKTVDGGM